MELTLSPTEIEELRKLQRNLQGRSDYARVTCILMLSMGNTPIFVADCLGIDISTTEELISANKTTKEICEIIGADSLGFLSEQGLIDSIGLNYDAPYSGLCMECYNGDYSAGLYDYEESYVNSMTDIQKEFLKERGRI